jgi:phospholipid transport system substrate-binding protein
MFIFEAVARLSVGQYWDKFSEPQKAEFTKYFTKLLGNSYLKKIREGYTNESVKFLDQQIRGDNKAVVVTRIVREGGQIPVDYSMLKIGGAWRIYDVKIEGVSLVSNYRAQFNEVLVNRPPDDLIEKVKKKVEQQAGGAVSADDDKI